MGVIRARVSDELEEKLKDIIEEQKRNIMGGKINISTIVRYSLKKYIKDYEENKIAEAKKRGMKNE